MHFFEDSVFYVRKSLFCIYLFPWSLVSGKCYELNSKISFVHSFSDDLLNLNLETISSLGISWYHWLKSLIFHSWYQICFLVHFLRHVHPISCNLRRVISYSDHVRRTRTLHISNSFRTFSSSPTPGALFWTICFPNLYNMTSLTAVITMFAVFLMVVALQMSEAVPTRPDSDTASIVESQGYVFEFPK